MYNPPLNIEWAEGEVAVVTKGGEEQGRFVARRRLLTEDRYVQPGGNGKTSHVVGIIKGVSQWCARSLTGFENSEVPCYTNEDGSGGCYALFTRKNLTMRGLGSNVIWNGFKPGTEEFGYIQIPKYDSYDLTAARARVGRGKMVWRIDSETADASASLALGLMQRFAEANPQDWFVSISSDYFAVPEDMLAWAARLPNLIVGHTVGTWRFGLDDLENRVSSLRHFLRAGVRTQVWVANRPEWRAEGRHQDLIDEAVSLVEPRQVISVAYHDGRVGHTENTVRLNPLGYCCDRMYDAEGRRVVNGMVEVDGQRVPLKGRSFGRCLGCRILCGVGHEQRLRKEAAGEVAA